MKTIPNVSERCWMMAALLWLTGCGAPAPGAELDDDFVADPSGQVDPDAPRDDGDPREPEPEPEPDDGPVEVTELRPEVVLLGYGDYAISGASEDDLYMGNSDGLLLHFDGNKWRPVDLGEAGEEVSYLGSVDDILAFPSGDVFVGTSGGSLLRFDGEAWHVEDPPAFYGFSSLWGLSPNDVYAVSRNRIAHFNGFEWSELETGLPNDIRWEAIHGSGPNNIVLAGRHADPPWDARFAHFDGTTWVEIETPEVGTLWDVFTAGPNHAVAVGKDGALLFDGQSLTQMNGAGSGLTSVWGTSAFEIFAVGGDQARRFNGSTWSSIGGPERPSEDSVQRFSSVFGFGGNHVYVAGSGLHRFDGAGWTTELPYANGINNLWASSPDNVLVLGYPSYRFDGERMTVEDMGADAPQLNAAWGQADRIFAVGNGGTAMLYDGEGWGYMTTNTSARLVDVWGSADDDVFAVGNDGVIMHFNGQSWGGLPSGTTSQLTGVWGSATDDVYAVGRDSTVLHYDGFDWLPMDIGIEGYITGIVGFDEQNIVAHSNFGLLHGNGLTWRPEEVVIDYKTDVEALDGTSPDNMFAAEYNWVAHYDGESWTKLHDGVRSGAKAVLAVSPREFYVAWYSIVYRFSAD